MTGGMKYTVPPSYTNWSGNGPISILLPFSRLNEYLTKLNLECCLIVTGVNNLTLKGRLIREKGLIDTSGICILQKRSGKYQSVNLISASCGPLYSEGLSY